MPVTWDSNNLHENITLSNGNLTATWVLAGGDYDAHVKANPVVLTSGKWYWEVVAGIIPDQALIIGIASDSDDEDDNQITVGYRDIGLLAYGPTTQVFGNSYHYGDIIGIAFDAGSGKIWFAKNNVWQAEGDPANGSNEAYTVTPGNLYYPAVSFFGLYDPDSGSATGKFAAGSLSYSPPSGFSHLATNEAVEISESFEVSDLTHTLRPLQEETVELDDAPDVSWEANAELPGGHGGFDDNAVSLLHFDGADEDTTFTDETGKEWTPHADAQLDTSQKVFGPTSGYFDGTGDYISTVQQADFNFGDGPFTIDFCHRPQDVSNYQCLVSLYAGAFNVQLTNSGGIRVTFPGNSWNDYGVYILSVDTWYHVAVTRDSSKDVRVFVDGTQVGTTQNKTQSIGLGTAAIGAILTESPSLYFTGHIDELRISNICRWTENFTPPGNKYSGPDDPHLVEISALITGQVESEATQEEGVTTADEISVGMFQQHNVPEAVSTDDVISGYSITEVEIEEATGLNADIRGIGAENVDIDEGMSLSDDMVGVIGNITEEVSLDDDISPEASEYGAEIPETLDLADELGVEVDTGVAEAVGLTDTAEAWRTAERGTAETTSLSDSVSFTEVYGKTVPELAQIWDKVSLTWNLKVEEVLNLSEAVTTELGWQIKEVLSMHETLSSIWSGTETIEDMLEIWGKVLICQVFNETAAEALEVTDTSTFVHQMLSSVAEALGITEVVTPAMTFNPVIVEAIGVIAAVTAIRTMSFTNEESIEATDALGWEWQENVSESIETTDTATLAYYALLALTENLELTETVLQNLMVDETLADVLDIIASLTMQASLNVLVEDALTIGLSVLLDGEVWECWVLSGNAFNPSVYSGFDFNSYATFGSSAWGAKDDGIYELTGDTDQGDAITPGIVLPATWFGTNRKKRFRKAYFGLVGGTTPAIRVETDSGSKTYTISDSKANLTRDMYGRQWVLKLQDFESLDFVTLWPVVLTR